MLNALIIAVLCFQNPAQDRDPNKPEVAPPRPGNPMFRELQQKMLTLVDSTRKLGDWQTQADLAGRAMEKVFQRSGWDSESDVFAMELVRAVDSVPPWEFERRGEVFFSGIARRYSLSDEQRQDLQRMVVREAFKVFAQHSNEIMTYSTDMIQTRAEGRPFDADQVARLAELMEPVLHDAHENVRGAAKGFMEQLDERQRARMVTDMEAADRRVAGIAKAMERWKQGQWTPEDWGIEDDPIQTGRGLGGSETGTVAIENMTPEDRLRQGVQAKRAAHERVREFEASLELARQSGDTDKANHLESELLRAQEDFNTAVEASKLVEPKSVQPAPEAVAGAQPIPPPETPVPPPADPNTRKPDSSKPKPELTDPWARYVDAYIRKYHLDSTQGQRAWLIYDESKARGDGVRERFGRRAADTAAKDSAAGDDKTSAALTEAAQTQQKELNRVFDQMRGRLEKIPTRAQRKNADPGDLPDPTAAPAPGKPPAKAAPAKPAGDSKTPR